MYNRRFDVSDDDDDDTDDDESQDDDQDRLLPPTDLNQDIFDLMVMLGSILSSMQAKKKAKSKRKVKLDVRFPRRALPSPASSPWVHIYASNCNKAMICFTGLNYAAFNYLSVMFEELYNKYTPYSRSGFIVLKKRVNRYRRPRSLDSRGCLALVLAHLRSRGSLNWLCMLFGTTYSVTQLFLRFGRRLLLLVLKNIPATKVTMPSEEDIREYQVIVAERFPTLDGVWFVMDGLRLSLQKPNVGEIQSKFYTGWKKDHTVNNVFVFCPGGTIIAAAINAPGCVHDSNLAFMGRVYDKLHDQYELYGGKGVVDQAFASALFPFLIKSGKEEDIPTTPRNCTTESRSNLFTTVSGMGYEGNPKLISTFI